MKHQNPSKRLLRLSIKYLLAAAAVVLTYFAVIYILFSLAGTSYRSAA
ncbi:acid stress-sensitive anti sigma factor RsiO, partial [Bacillus velezensis]